MKGPVRAAFWQQYAESPPLVALAGSKIDSIVHASIGLNSGLASDLTDRILSSLEGSKIFFPDHRGEALRAAAERLARGDRTTSLLRLARLTDDPDLTPDIVASLAPKVSDDVIGRAWNEAMQTVSRRGVTGKTDFLRALAPRVTSAVVPTAWPKLISVSEQLKDDSWLEIAVALPVAPGSADEANLCELLERVQYDDLELGDLKIVDRVFSRMSSDGRARCWDQLAGFVAENGFYVEATNVLTRRVMPGLARLVLPVHANALWNAVVTNAVGAKGRLDLNRWEALLEAASNLPTSGASDKAFPTWTKLLSQQQPHDLGDWNKRNWLLSLRTVASRIPGPDVHRARRQALALLSFVKDARTRSGVVHLLSMLKPEANRIDAARFWQETRLLLNAEPQHEFDEPHVRSALIVAMERMPQAVCLGAWNALIELLVTDRNTDGRALTALRALAPRMPTVDRLSAQRALLPLLASPRVPIDDLGDLLLVARGLSAPLPQSIFDRLWKRVADGFEGYVSGTRGLSSLLDGLPAPPSPEIYLSMASRVTTEGADPVHTSYLLNVASSLAHHANANSALAVWNRLFRPHDRFGTHFNDNDLQSLERIAASLLSKLQTTARLTAVGAALRQSVKNESSDHKEAMLRLLTRLVAASPELELDLCRSMATVAAEGPQEALTDLSWMWANLRCGARPAHLMLSDREAFLRREAVRSHGTVMALEELIPVPPDGSSADAATVVRNGLEILKYPSISRELRDVVVKRLIRYLPDSNSGTSIGAIVEQARRVYAIGDIAAPARNPCYLQDYMGCVGIRDIE